MTLSDRYRTAWDGFWEQSSGEPGKGLGLRLAFRSVVLSRPPPRSPVATGPGLPVVRGYHGTAGGGRSVRGVLARPETGCARAGRTGAGQKGCDGGGRRSGIVR